MPWDLGTCPPALNTQDLPVPGSKDASTHSPFGEVLVSVNPYQELPLYGPEASPGTRAASSMRPPHLYAVAKRLQSNGRGPGTPALLFQVPA